MQKKGIGNREGGAVLPKAQVSLEYLTMTGLLLLAVGIFFGVSFLYYADTSESQLARTAAQTMASAADQAAGLGEGTSIVTTIDLPDHVSAITRSGKSVSVRLTGSGGTVRDFFAVSRADINGVTFLSNPPGGGRHWIRVRYAGGVAWIEELP